MSTRVEDRRIARLPAWLPVSAQPRSVGAVIKNIRRHWFIHMLMLPGIICMVIFKYVPMYGLLVAFKDLNMRKGILASPWVGLQNFQVLFQEPYFYKVILNTLIINTYNIVIGFPFVILLALLLNEVKAGWFKRTSQTFVYIPHFVSWVVFAAIVSRMLHPDPDGFLNIIVGLLGVRPRYWLTVPEYFRAIVVITGILKTAGFATIIYLAAISTVNPELIESAVCDGAHRGHLMWHVYLPRIMPTIAVLLILNVANLFASNFDQIFNLYNPAVWDTGDVLSTYLYRRGLLAGKFEMGAALGLVFNVLGLAMVVLTNRIITKMNVMGIF